MSDLPPFEARLARLMDRRSMPARAGGEPDDARLRSVATALGLHAADLFLFAGRTVPDDLAPARLGGPWDVGHLTSEACHLDAQDFARLRRFVSDLPSGAVTRTQPFPPDGRDTTAGTIVRRLLGNRNIRISNTTLVTVGGGPFKATSAYAKVCGGTLPLSDDYVNAFARTLGIPVGDLAALLGIEAEEQPWDKPFPWRPETAGLAWSGRHLDDSQLRAALDYAESMTRAYRRADPAKK